MSGAQSYSLGASEAEVARLDAQAARIAAPTALFLGGAGIAAGMRVLDLGTGLGHVAFLLGELVGASGEVVGIDQAAALLAVAEQRKVAAGAGNVHFVADVRVFRDMRPFDAVVGRLILFHLPDPAEVLRHHLEGLADGGLMLMIDFDLGSARSEPPAPLFNAAWDWVMAAFRHAGANPVIGTQLGRLLREAGLTDVDHFGLQRYLSADDPDGALLPSSGVKSLAPVIVAAGIATEEELALDTLEARLVADLQTHRAVGLDSHDRWCLGSQALGSLSRPDRIRRGGDRGAVGRTWRGVAPRRCLSVRGTLSSRQDLHQRQRRFICRARGVRPSPRGDLRGIPKLRSSDYSQNDSGWVMRRLSYGRNGARIGAASAQAGGSWPTAGQQAGWWLHPASARITKMAAGPPGPVGETAVRGPVSLSVPGRWPSHCG
jgi:SAM-dependent methyltransferase